MPYNKYLKAWLTRVPAPSEFGKMEDTGMNDKIKAEADHLHEITMDDARALPNMLGVLCSTGLRMKGWYGCTISGEKHLYILKA